MKFLMVGSALALLIGSPAFAQTTAPVNSSQMDAASAQNDNMKASQKSTDRGGAANLAAAQKIQQDLQSAGFTDVKVVAESFVVQARSKDGNPVVMTIGPQGMSVFEAVNSGSSGSGSGTVGSSAESQKSGQSSSDSSTNSNPASRK